MARNPLRKRSKLEAAGDRADLAAESVREAAATLRDRADSLLSEIDALSPPVPPVPHKRRRPVLLVAVLGAAAAIAYAIRKASGSPADDLPAPATVTPTAPAGPTDDRLNDPALKAKVSSELFADDDAEKAKINIGVADGVVTLRGEISSDGMIGELTSRTAAIEGVRRVENLLTAADGKEPSKTEG